MILIGHRKSIPDAVCLSVEEYIQQKLSYPEMIARGEPFIFGVNIPLIYAFGPRTYWRVKGIDFAIYGQACDPEDYEEMEDILDMRRIGNIYGRWYSRYQKDGEAGYQMFNTVEQIGYNEFAKAIDRYEKGYD
jgi:hypothetical protein